MIDLKDLTRKANIFLFKMDVDARIRLWRKLGKLLSDNISILEALAEIKTTRSPSEPIYLAMDEWIAALTHGRKVSEAVRDWVTDEEAMLILAGEQAGSLGKTMESVVTVTQAKKSIQASIIGGLAYPTFLILVAFGTLYLFGFKVIPAFSRAAQGDRWTGLARTMVDSSAFIQNWFLAIVIVAIAIVIGIVVSMPYWTGLTRTKFDRYAPYSIYRVTQGATWVISLSALIQAGMRIQEAMEQLMINASPWAKERVGAALLGLRSGKNLGAALVASRYEFPDREIIADIRVYANKSGFDDALKTIGQEWITESVVRIQALMRKVFSAAIMLAGGIIGFMVLGMFAMQTQLTQLLQAGR